MKKEFVLMLIAPTLACGLLSESESARWKKATRVYVAVDGAAVLENIDKAYAAGKAPTIQNSPPVYATRSGRLLVWMKERDIPLSTSYTPMTPHQALAVANRMDGGGGICVGAEIGCARTITSAEVSEMEGALKDGAGADEKFALTRKQ